MNSKELLPHQQRVVAERDEVKDRLDKLISFLQKGKPDNIDDENWSLLEEQRDAMNWYYVVLDSRIELF